MIARSHYDRDTLSRFLDDEVGDDAADMSSHIESCEGCRSTLESLVGEGLTMELAGDLLRGIEQPCEGSDFDLLGRATVTTQTTHSNFSSTTTTRTSASSVRVL